MPQYEPTENPQYVGRLNSTNPYALEHESQFKDFGPPPPNVYVARQAHKPQGETKMLYADHSADESVTTRKQGASYDHPCSPAAMKPGQTVKFLPELTVKRAQSPGFFDPPMTYQSGQVRWYFQPSWETAMVAALKKAGVTKPNKKPIEVEDVQSKLEELRLDDGTKEELDKPYLHHPSDRHLAIFKYESSASLIARVSHRSLVIVCPYIPADGTGWERIWDTKNRPPIIVRWSTGQQAVYPPLILGCLPKPNSGVGKEALVKDVHWFCLEPKRTTAFEKLWYSMWINRGGVGTLSKIAESFRWPMTLEPEVFVWTLVLLHRTIALGTPVPDSSLGTWIHQYGQHLVKCGNPYKASQFMFDDKKKYDGKSVTYLELTAWIMTPEFSKKAQEFAKRWDDAINAMIVYKCNVNDENWTAMRKQFLVARQPPLR